MNSSLVTRFISQSSWQEELWDRLLLWCFNENVAMLKSCCNAVACFVKKHSLTVLSNAVTRKSYKLAVARLKVRSQQTYHKTSKRSERCRLDSAGGWPPKPDRTLNTKTTKQSLGHACWQQQKRIGLDKASTRKNMMNQRGKMSCRKSGQNKEGESKLWRDSKDNVHLWRVWHGKTLGWRIFLIMLFRDLDMCLLCFAVEFCCCVLMLHFSYGLARKPCRNLSAPFQTCIKTKKHPKLTNCPCFWSIFYKWHGFNTICDLL